MSVEVRQFRRQLAGLQVLAAIPGCLLEDKMLTDKFFGI